MKNESQLNEYIIINYLLNNSKEVENLDINENHFLNSNARNYYLALKELNRRSLEFQIDTFASIVSEYQEHDYSEIHAIHKDKVNPNINYHIEKLKNEYVKQSLIKKGINKWISQASKDEPINLESLSNDLNEIQKAISIVKNDIEIFNGKQLGEWYTKELSNRKLGISNKWSYGYREIDKLFPRPCEEGQMSFFAGTVGSGKSLLAKSMMIRQSRMTTQNGKRIPVVYLSCEMKKTSFMDRMTTFETGIDTMTLNDMEIEDEKHNIAMESSLKMFSDSPNFMFTDYASIGLNELEYIYEYCKREFIKNNVVNSLDKKPYMVMWIDTVDSLNIMGDLKPDAISKGMDTLSKFANLKDIHLCLVGQIGENKIRGKTFSSPEEIDNFSYTMSDIYGSARVSQKVRATFIFIRSILEKIRAFPNMIDDFRNVPDMLRLSLLKNNEGINDNVWFEFIKRYLDFHERPNYNPNGNDLFERDDE